MMKKLAILMILVLCAVMLGGCMSGTSAAPVNSVAFIRVDAASDVNLTVDKDNKVIAVNYGMVDKTPVKKSETAYKDSTLLDKTLKEAVAEIIKVNGTDSAISVKIVSATGKEEAVKSVKDVLPKAFSEVFTANKAGCDVTVKYGLPDKTDSDVVVAELKGADFTSSSETSSEAE